ncbi:MAG: hypothetical protein Q7T36_10700 [Fluviicoccus sp.]|nr:hypothetical protein [Fluviicoccus sp.]MDO8330924.1 hypothetical protein [Fluviicoccus sp.]
MSKTNYVLLGLVVVLLTTLINLSQSKGTASRSWSSGNSSSFGSGGWSHK